MADSGQLNAQLGISTNLRFIVLYEGDFVHVDDEWKWRGSETTSLLVPSDITVAGLVVRLMEKLRIQDPSTQIELKFKTPYKNAPPMKIRDNGDLNYYISLHMETPLYVILRETEVPNGLHIARTTEMKDPTFVTEKGYSGNHLLDIEQINLEAQHRWLHPAEICEILRNYKKIPLYQEPPNRPPSGSLFLFNRKVRRHFRKDGHNWRKTRDGKTVKEANEKLKVEGVDVLRCYYAHGEEDQDFQRRSYWMLEEVLSHIVLVHYRDVKANRTNFNCYRESKVIPDSPKPRENIHNFGSSVFSEIRPNSYEGTLQVMDSASLDHAYASEFENAESVYGHQQCPGFQSSDNVLQPVVQKMRDGSIPYCDVPISDNYPGQLSAITGASFESIAQREKNKNSMDNGLTYELHCDHDFQPWENVMDISTNGFQANNFLPPFSPAQSSVDVMLGQENELLGELIIDLACLDM